MRKVIWLLEDLQRMGRPYLCDDVELEAWLALLDFYMTPYIEEFIDRQGKLTPDSIVHLRNCKQRLAPLLKQLARSSYARQSGGRYIFLIVTV